MYDATKKNFGQNFASDISDKMFWTNDSEAANGGVLQIICSTAARKLKLDMLAGS